LKNCVDIKEKFGGSDEHLKFEKEDMT